MNGPPHAIVVQVSARRWRIAERIGSDSSGHGEPMIAVYQVAPGLPYRSRRDAYTDAALVSKRLRRED